MPDLNILENPNEPEDIMWPEPDQDQAALWQEIENNIDQKTYDNDLTFRQLPAKTKIAISLNFASQRIEQIGQANKLDNRQTNLIAKTIKKILIKEISPDQIVNYLSQSLPIDTKKAQKIFLEIEEKILKAFVFDYDKPITESVQPYSFDKINLESNQSLNQPLPSLPPLEKRETDQTISQTNQFNQYNMPEEEKELTSPAPTPLSRPQPKLDGNVIDLKNLDNY